LFLRVNYINTNSAALGYTMAVNSVAVPNFWLFTAEVNECTQYQDDSTPMYWGFELFLDGVSSLDVTGDATPLDFSTCAVYTTNTITTETIECVENCLTDEEAEKMMRHAMSFCECCLEVKIDNEPFN